jgi:F0F1-type ATP synthase delta subunit
MITKTKRINWIQDIRDGFLFAGVGDHIGTYFNDLHQTCRRIKLYVSQDLTDEQLEKVQKYVQSKKNEYNVTVARWSGNRWYGNVVVYFRPKVGLWMK